LSTFYVITAQESDGPKGTKLDFETSGKLKSQTVIAATRGTTVAVEEIFKNLPVRRKELERNIKREYQKVLNLLNAYACISVGVRFMVSNTLAKGYGIHSSRTNQLY
jgi:DNA mismatch repair protein PMS2